MDLKNIWRNINTLGLEKLESIRPKEHKKPMANVNGFYLLGGAYGVYIGWGLFKGALSGEAGTGGERIAGFAAAAVLIAAGGYILFRQYQRYRYGKKHMDDPSTWNDEEAAAAGEETAAEAVTEGLPGQSAAESAERPKDTEDGLPATGSAEEETPS